MECHECARKNFVEPYINAPYIQQMFRIDDSIRFSFVPTCIYLIAVLRSSHTLETICWTLWWAVFSIIARVTVEHKTFYKRTPGWWEAWNARCIFATTCMAVLYACQVPYAWCGVFLLRAAGAKRVAFVGFFAWCIFLAAGVVAFKPWPVLLLVWAITKQWSEKERCDPVVYWARRSAVTALHQEIKWCIWCEAVFPHIVRHDVTALAWVITFVMALHRWAVHIPPKKVYKFTEMAATHVPAPSIEAALACGYCKSKLQIDDEERVYDKKAAPSKKTATKKSKQPETRQAQRPMFQGMPHAQSQGTPQPYAQPYAQSHDPYYGQALQGAQPQNDGVCDFI